MTIPSHPLLIQGAKLRADRRSHDTFLLWPEQGLVLNETALAIVRLCTGEFTVDTIIDRLASQHVDASRAIVAEDVLTFLRRLAERGLIMEHIEV